MDTLRLQLRFLLPLIATLVAAAYLALPLMDQLTGRRFARDRNIRGALIGNALNDSIREALADPRGGRLQGYY
jgi:trehalose 6-phosphate synthase